MTDIHQWLDRLGLAGKYAARFAAEAVETDVLPTLSEADLAALGVVLGDRKRILRAIAEEARRAGEADPAAPRESGAERRQVTLMFCDLVGSTRISSRLDPEDMRELLQGFFELCGEAVRRYGGTVAKQLGDGILAYFGQPLAHGDDPARALMAALAVVDGIDFFRRGPAARLGAEVAVRIGIHTGEVVVGDMGEQSARERDAVVGDAPNIAARLQALADPDTIFVSDLTRRLAGEAFDCRDLGFHRIKGVADPVRIWRVLARHDEGAGRITPANAPIVGRETELARIARLWDAAREGRGGVAVIEGEPGIGKSRLVAELRRRFEAEGAATVALLCSPFHRNTALFPLIQQLTAGLSLGQGQAGERLGRLRGWVEALGLDAARVVPVLARLLDIDTAESSLPPPPADPRRLRSELFAVLLDIGGALSAQRPLLLIVEDCHWSDPSLSEFLPLCAQRYRDRPVLILVTTRSGEPTPFDEGSAVTVRLGPLSPDDSRALLLGLSEGRPLPEAVAERILARTDGVPLYVEEVTRSLLEGRQGEYGRGEDAAGIPATLQDTLMARLDNLRHSRELARVAAVLGRGCSRAQLAAATELDPAALEQGIEELLEAGIFALAPEREGPLYQFRHALIQQIAYSSMVKPRRAELHGRVARVLSTQFPEIAESQPETLARHFESAGQAAEAIAYWRRAAAQAIARSANAEAIADLRRALTLCPQVAPEEERKATETRLLLSLGARLLSVHGFAAPEVEETYARARELSIESGSPATVAPVHWGLWGFYLVAVRLREAAEIAEAFLAAVASSSNPPLAAQYCRGVTRFYRGDFGGAAADFRAALERHVETAARPDIEVYGVDLGVCCHAYLGWNEALAGDAAAALEAAARATARGGETGHAFSQAFAAVFCAQMHLFLGDAAAAEPLARESAELSRRYGFAQLEAQSLMQIGRCRLAAGHPVEAREMIAQGLRDYQATGAGLARPYASAWLAEALGALGDASGALDVIDQTLAWTAAHDERYFDAELLALRGDMLALAGREGAEAGWTRAADLARRMAANAAWLRAELRLARAARDRHGLAGLRAARAACAGRLLTADMRAADDILRAADGG